MVVLQTYSILLHFSSRLSVGCSGNLKGVFLCFLSLSFIPLIIAIPLDHNKADVLFPRGAEQYCDRIDGNPDFYGLGIRTGIYMQWLSSLLANLFLPEAIDGNLDTNTIFLLALFFAMCVAASGHVDGSALVTPEIIVLLQLSFGFLGSILTIWGYRTRVSVGNPMRFSLLGSTVRIALATLVSAFSVWFWFLGLDRHEPQAGCSSVTFMFAQVSVNQGVATFYKIQSVLVAVIYVFLFAREYLLIGYFLYFTAIWTSLIALFSIIFSPRIEEQNWENVRSELEIYYKQGKFPGIMLLRKGFRPAVRTLRNVFLQWLRLSAFIFWSHANGENSGGDRRPSLSVWTVPFLQPFLFMLVTIFKWICLFLFGWCPSVASISPAIRVGMNRVHLQFMAIFPDEDVLNCRSVRFAIYATNTLVIIWTIIAVELTIWWNRIDGVYTLRSPGQLIPLLIGVVSFLRVLHGLSIPISTSAVTDWYYQLFDGTSEDDFQNIDQKDLRVLDLSSKEVWFTKRATKVVFVKRVPRRRHSVSEPISKYAEAENFMALQAQILDKSRSEAADPLPSSSLGSGSSNVCDVFGHDGGMVVKLHRDFRDIQPPLLDRLYGSGLQAHRSEMKIPENIDRDYGSLSAAAYCRQERLELSWRIERLHNMNKRYIMRQVDHRPGIVRFAGVLKDREVPNSDESEHPSGTDLPVTTSPDDHNSQSLSKRQQSRRESNFIPKVSKKDNFYALRLAILYVVWSTWIASCGLIALVRLAWKPFPWLRKRAGKTTLRLIELQLVDLEAHFHTVKSVIRITGKLTMKETRKAQKESMIQKWVIEQVDALNISRTKSVSSFHFINAVPLLLIVNSRYVVYFVLKLLQQELQRGSRRGKKNRRSASNDDNRPAVKAPFEAESGSRACDESESEGNPKSNSEMDTENQQPPQSAPRGPTSKRLGDVMNALITGVIAGANAKRHTVAETDEERLDRVTIDDLRATSAALTAFLNSHHFMNSLQRRSLPLLIFYTTTYAEMVFGDMRLYEAQKWMRKINNGIFYLKTVRIQHQHKKIGWGKQHSEAIRLWNEIIVRAKWAEVIDLTKDRLRERRREHPARGLINIHPDHNINSQDLPERRQESNQPSNLRRFSWPAWYYQHEDEFGLLNASSSD